MEEKKTQSRWKSKVLWAAIAAQILVLLQITGTLDKIGLTETSFNNVITAALQILSIFGIINDPTNAEGV